MRPETPPKSPLTQYLEKKDKALYGKIAELRAEVTRWLTYVPETFGHYTSHTIDHADEIVSQISKLLFPERKSKPIVHLGPVAAYILIASAYLHDAGMVTSEQEKQVILASEEWRKWTMEGSAKERWHRIQASRQQAGDDPNRHLAVDRATRLLIAEYVRRQHHHRAGELVRGRALELGRIDFAEPMVLNAIADICMAHGLDRHELQDDERFPEERDILREKVNLRLLATLLRLGDLLDLRYDRACPLLLQAACPLPADSIAHWGQYEVIKHLSTSPKRIEITALCRNPDEHRVLHDWCTWLIREIESLPARLPKTEWKLPQATMDGRSPTIIIQPDKDASYIPGTWSFELDQDAVFERLISDVYTEPEVFIRELIQNALDATRCQMYLDLAAAGMEAPEFPTDVPAEWRKRYRIEVKLREETIRNPDTKEREVVQYVSVEDFGIGMDQDILRRHFLQIGRSYYTTAEFRRNFQFHPTSRFGIGFLSVFAVSDEVAIETYKPTSHRKDGGIHLRLTGPRSYILTEKARRNKSGTRIEVRLRKPLSKSLTELVHGWCVFVEFPVLVVDKAAASILVDNKGLNALHKEYIDPSSPNISYVRRVYPLNLPGIRGGFVVVARIEGGKERWVSPSPWAVPLFSDLHLSSTIAFHGIRLSHKQLYSSTLLTEFLDLRRPMQINTSRSEIDVSHWKDVQTRIEEIVIEHLDKENQSSGQPSGDAQSFPWEDWRYRMQLAADSRLFDLPLWQQRRDMVPVWIDGRMEVCSPREVLAREAFYLLPIYPLSVRAEQPLDWADLSRKMPRGAVLVHSSLVSTADLMGDRPSFWGRVIDSVKPVSVIKVPGEHLAVECRQQTSAPIRTVYAPLGRFITILCASQCRFEVIRCGSQNRGWYIFNSATPFGQWYLRVVQLNADGRVPISAIMQLDSAFWGMDSRLPEHLKGWNALHSQQPELQCPNVNPLMDEWGPDEPEPDA